MAGRRAKTLDERALAKALQAAEASTDPLRDRVMVLLSVRAGLRACEIARLDWSMVLDGNGRVGRLLELRDRAAKRQSGRSIPLHPDLRQALAALKGLVRPRAPSSVHDVADLSRPTAW